MLAVTRRQADVPSPTRLPSYCCAIEGVTRMRSERLAENYTSPLPCPQTVANDR